MSLELLMLTMVLSFAQLAKITGRRKSGLETNEPRFYELLLKRQGLPISV